eukprot:gene9092-11143_t
MALVYNQNTVNPYYYYYNMDYNNPSYPSPAVDQYIYYHPTPLIQESYQTSPMLPMKRLFPDEPLIEDEIIMERQSSDQHSDESNDVEDESGDEDDTAQQEEQLKQFLYPFVQQILHSSFSNSIFPIISECTREDISVKIMLAKLKTLCSELKIDYIYSNLLQNFVRLDGDIRMVNYLVENGVTDPDLEFVKEIELTHTNLEVAKKKRERKRESISRGIRSPPNKWSKEESQNLIKLVTENGEKQWKKIASKLGGGKTGAQCAQHWKRVLSPEIKKGSWDEDEEDLLFQLVDKHGQSWKNVAMEIKTRTDIQCRYQYFKACMSRQTEWSPLEDEILTKKIKLMFNNEKTISFQQVAKHLARAKTTKIPRTALECKIRFQTLSTQLFPTMSSPNYQSAVVPVFYRNPNEVNNGLVSQSPPYQSAGNPIVIMQS